VVPVLAAGAAGGEDHGGQRGRGEDWHQERDERGPRPRGRPRSFGSLRPAGQVGEELLEVAPDPGAQRAPGPVLELGRLDPARLKVLATVR